MEITLTAKQHAFIIGLLPNSGHPDVIRYLTQVAKQLVLPVADEQAITVSVPESLVAEIYNIMGTQQERIASSLNNAIKQALLPQVAGVASLVEVLTQRDQDSSKIIAELLANAYSFIESLK